MKNLMYRKEAARGAVSVWKLCLYQMFQIKAWTVKMDIFNASHKRDPAHKMLSWVRIVFWRPHCSLPSSLFVSPPFSPPSISQCARWHRKDWKWHTLIRARSSAPTHPAPAVTHAPGFAFRSSPRFVISSCFSVSFPLTSVFRSFLRSFFLLRMKPWVQRRAAWHQWDALRGRRRTNERVKGRTKQSRHWSQGPFSDCL